MRSVGVDWWMNFTQPKPIGRDIANGTVTPFGGYDNALVFNQPGSGGDCGWPGVVARLTMSCPVTGIALTMCTDQPSVQFYSGNFLNGSIPRKASQGGPSVGYPRWSAAALEAQHFPDSVHHPSWPTTVLAAGATYTQTTVYQVTTG
jgi:aldose 1-epimerase